MSIWGFLLLYISQSNVADTKEDIKKASLSLFHTDPHTTYNFKIESIPKA